MNYKLLQFIGVFLFIFTVTLGFKLQVFNNIVNNNLNKANLENINIISHLEKKTLNTVNNITDNIQNYIQVGDVIIKGNKKYLIYGADIKKEIGYTYKKALYLEKIVGSNFLELNKNSKGKLFILTKISDNLVCKPGYAVDISNLLDLITKIKSAGIDPYTMKDTNGNLKSVDEVAILAHLNGKEKETLNILTNKYCQLGSNINSSNLKIYMFVNDKTIRKIGQDEYAKFSAVLIDVINKNNNQRIGYLMPLVNIDGKINIKMGGEGADISEDNIDAICDAGFYFDRQEERCKPNIERNLIFSTHFETISNGYINPDINKVSGGFNLTSGKEYYSNKSPKNNWIDDGLYFYNGTGVTNINATFYTGYSLSLWFESKNNTDGNILTDNIDGLVIKKKNSRIYVKIQGKEVEVGPIYNNQLYNIFLTYDKITKRVGIYLNGNPIIKAEDNNNILGNGFTKDVTIGNKFILGTGNVYYSIKLWNEGFGDYLSNIIYNFENNLGQDYNGIINPWGTVIYNGPNTCISNGLQTIENDIGVGVVNCGRESKLPGKIYYKNKFNNGFYDNKLVSDIGADSTLLGLEDNNTNQLNINDLNYILTKKSNNNLALDISKALNEDIHLDLDYSSYDSNGYTIGFVLSDANDGTITDGVISIIKNGNKIKIDNNEFDYSNSSDNNILISTNKNTNKTSICVSNSISKKCIILNNKLNEGQINFKQGVIDNIIYKKYSINQASAKYIVSTLNSMGENLNIITSCDVINNNGIYTIKNGDKVYNTYCYKDNNGNTYQLLYTSIYSKFDENSTKFKDKWNSIRGNGNIVYYTDIVDVCRQYNLKPYYVRADNTEWFNILNNFIQNYTNYKQTKGNWGGIVIGLWYDQAKQGWYNLDNIASNGMGIGTFKYTLGSNLPNNTNGNSMDQNLRFGAIWAGTDNGNGPEDFNGDGTLGVICGGKEDNGLTPPIQVADFTTLDNNLDTREEYIYTYNGTNWTKGDFYACPVGKVYDRINQVCKKTNDGNLVKVYDLSDVYKADEKYIPDNNSEFNNLDQKYFTGEYIEGAYTGYNYNKIGDTNYSKLRDNNPYDSANGDTLYGVRVDGELCIPEEKDYQIAVDGGGTSEFVINVDGALYGSKKYGDNKAQKDKIDILQLHLKKGCYPVILRYSASDKDEDNYVVWFNNGNGWDILKGNYLKMYKGEDYLNKNNEPVLNSNQ